MGTEFRAESDSVGAQYDVTHEYFYWSKKKEQNFLLQRKENLFLMFVSTCLFNLFININKLDALIL